MSITVRASSFGGCVKAQVAACLGYEPMAPPNRMQEIFDRGNVHEDENAAALRMAGHDIYDEQVEVCIDRAPIGSVVGHIDGQIAMNGYNDMLWESKSPNAWAKFEKAHKTGTYDDPLTQRYAWQISVYMHALDLEAYVTCLETIPCPRCKGTGIWYDGNGADLSEQYEIPCPQCDGGNIPAEGRVKGFVIETPPYTMQDITDRLISINEWVKIGQLPQLCSSNDYPCPFVYLHEDDVEVVDDPELDRLVSIYEEFGRQEKQAADQKKAVAAEIKAYITVDETVTTGGSKVTRYERKAAARYDMDALRITMQETGRSLDDYLIEGKPSVQVRITRQEGS